MPGLSGSEVLLFIDSGSGPELVGSQRGLTRDEAAEEIDTSSKDGRAKRVLSGRYSSGLSLEALYVPGGAAYAALKAALRNGTEVIAVIEEEGVYEESATCIVTSLSEDYPDSAESTVSCSLVVDGDWTSGT